MSYVEARDLPIGEFVSLNYMQFQMDKAEQERQKEEEVKAAREARRAGKRPVGGNYIPKSVMQDIEDELT